MNKKLPGIYKGNDFSNVNNNKKIYYSSIKEDRSESVNSIEDYMLNTPVVIKTNSETLNTKIVSKQKNHILTTENKIIYIRDIISINSIKI